MRISFVRTISFRPTRHVTLTACLAALLAGCGGGGGDGPATDISQGTEQELLAVRSKPLPADHPKMRDPAPAPAPAPAPTPAPAPAISGVNLTSYGARCDGVTDDTAAIVRGIADARARNVPLLVPASQCNFSDVLRLDSAHIVGTGPSSVLYATRWDRAAIFMYGAGPSVSKVRLTGTKAPSRQAAWEMTKITVFGASDFVIDNVLIEDAPAASIQTANAATRGRISNNTIRNSLSDSIHLTGSASHITVEGNLIEYSGDDGIAVVSYTKESAAGRVNNVTARNNIVRNSKFGRNMSVVGGTNILYENNLLQTNLAGLACFLLAQENVLPYATMGSDNVRFVRNTLENCGSHMTGHGAVLIYSDGTEPVNNAVLANNDLIQSGQTGIRVYGQTIYGLRLENNKIAGASPAYNIVTPGVTVIQYSTGAVGYAAP